MFTCFLEVLELASSENQSRGRIYSDVIRVWSVCDKKRVDAEIARVYQCYMRGQQSLLRKELRGILAPQPDSASEAGGVKLPITYTEADTSGARGAAGKTRNQAKDTHQLIVPASSFHGSDNKLVKFYDFDPITDYVLQRQTAHITGPLATSSLAEDASSTVTSTSETTPSMPQSTDEELAADTFAVELPFRLTEMEYAIVNLKPSPPEPIILLGRSGTGKTTCCLYRMFAQFISYWFKCNRHRGRPLIRRPVRRRVQHTPPTYPAAASGETSGEGAKSGR